MASKSWPVWSIAFSLDGRLLAAGRGYRDNETFWPEGGDGKVTVWGVEDWKEQIGFSAPFTHQAEDIAFTSDGKYLAAASNQFFRVPPDQRNRSGKRDIWGRHVHGAPNPWDGNVVSVVSGSS